MARQKDRTEADAVYRRFNDFVGTRMDLEASRKRYALLAEGFDLAADARHEPVTLGGVPGEKVSVPQSRADAALLYLHGGGYLTGHAAAYRHMVAEAARESRTTAWAIDYALAPENPFPRGIEDAVSAYLALLESHAAERVVIAGDSAGGGLTLGLLLTLRERGLPMPAGAWLISPLGDLAREGESQHLKAALDPIDLPLNARKATSAAYLAGAPVNDPRASPVHADMTGLPPMRIDVGSHETLLDDSLSIARRAALADVDVTLQVWGGMIHIFPFFFPMLKEGRECLKAAGSFLAAQLD